MTLKHRTPNRLVRRLRPSPERFAAAVAAYDPWLLLALQAARPRRRQEALTSTRPVR